jgi:hypothetical protein
MQMEEMESTMTDDQFMIHVLNNLTSEYKMDVSKLEDRICTKNDPLDIEDTRDALCLTF